MLKPGRRKIIRRLALQLCLLGLLGVVSLPLAGQQIHRHSFSNRQTAFVRGDANVAVEELEHDLSPLSFKSQPTSEHFKLASDAAVGDSAYIHYFYETPPAPITEALTASVWLKATRAGAQLRARIVLPKERDPQRPDDPLTTVLIGDSYADPKSWRKLTLQNLPELLQKHLPVLRTRVGRDINIEDAYIDRIILNLYSGPGVVDVWVDDLDIGPVRPQSKVQGGRELAPGLPTGLVGSRSLDRGAMNLKAHAVSLEAGQLFVDNKPFFFRAIRHTPGTPLYPLRMAGFNTLWFPPDALPSVIEEAAREGFMVVPTLPPMPRGKLSEVALQYEAERFSGLFQKFVASESVLFWDIGHRYDSERVEAAEQMAQLIRQQPIPSRPIAADVWDDFQSYSLYLDMVSAHRWPLFTSLELRTYRDWLAQRRELTPTPKNLFYTWVQTHMPDWYVEVLTGRRDVDRFEDPIGPQPEQIRLLTYISLAIGSRGLGFWSDRYLSESHQGRDRLLALALINAELDMLAPLLNGTRIAEGPRVEWVSTSHADVQAAVLRRKEGVLVLPIWLGSGSQYVPPQGALPQVTLTLKLIPEGADPWLISPSGIKCLRTTTKKVPTGTELTIPEFDLVAPVVFTNDLSERGLVAQWQEYNRTHAQLAAQWALDLAAEQYMKVLAVHQQLLNLGIDVRESDRLFFEARKRYGDAQKDFDKEMWDRAHLNATRALRPLRILMRDHWQKAVATLSTPSASPYATSYYSLPLHWRLAQEVRQGQLSANVLDGGDFESSGPAPKNGRAISELPGWSARMGAIRSDRVVMAAGIVPAEGLEDRRVARKYPEPYPSIFKPGRPIIPNDEGYLPPSPALGRNCLKLEVRSRLETTKDGKPMPLIPTLERTFLAVDSPSVSLPPGTLVRVSAWIKVSHEIQGSPDGLLFYDDALGEPLSVRVTRTPTYPIDGNALRQEGGWQHYHLYRRVPASGQIAVTVALTGVGVAYVDDIRIEPIVSPGRNIPPWTEPIRQIHGTVSDQPASSGEKTPPGGPRWIAPPAGPATTSLYPQGVPTLPTISLP